MLKYKKYNYVFRTLDLQLNLSRFNSNATAIINDKTISPSTFSTAWQSAKPFEEIPTMNSFKLIGSFLPGGKYSKLDVTQLLLALKDDMGDICKLPGLFGQTDIIVTHNVQDFETLYRNEGIWPKRPGMDALNYHRSVYRADIFQGIDGLLATHNEKWNAFRSAVNPVLMQPKNVQLYLEKMSQVNKEFVCSVAGLLHEREDVHLADTTEWQSAKPYKEIPTINTLTLIKNFLPRGKYYELDSKQTFLAFEKEYGKIVRLPGLFGRPDVVYSYNEQDFEQIHRNEGVWPKRPGFVTLRYHRGVHRADFFQGVKGLLAMSGEGWGKIRSLINPILMQPQNVRLYLNKMSQVNKELIERIREIRDPSSLEVPSTFEEEINRWALESVSVVALDKHLGLIKENRNNPEAKIMFKTLTDFIALSLDIEIKPSVWRYIRTPTFNKLMNSLDTLLEIITLYINEAIVRLEQESKNGAAEKPEHEKSVLEKLLKIDKKIAIVMAIDMLMAGVDTTTTTLTGILLCLAKNPEKQAKLREEIMSILPHKDSEFTEETFKHMPYLRACIKEALRYYPLTVGNSRAPVKDVVLSGYRVPKDTRITMVSVSLLRNEKYFIRPNEYLPERWLRTSKETNNIQQSPSEGSLKPKCPFIYLPFGFGPRTCIGRRIAEMELELAIARMIRNFYVDFNYSTDNAFKSVLMNVPNIPLQFKFNDVEY